MGLINTKILASFPVALNKSGSANLRPILATIQILLQSLPPTSRANKAQISGP
jgi:hypothetical protein